MEKQKFTRRQFLGIGLGVLAFPAIASAASLFTKTNGYSETGAAINGLMTVKGNTYGYLAGVKQINRQFKINSATYQAKSGDGKLCKSEWYPSAKTLDRYWYESNCKMKTSGELNTTGGVDTWYYIDETTHKPYTGWKCIEDKKTGNVNNNTAKWVFYDKSDGHMLHGEACIPRDNKTTETGWYYFDDYTGATTYGFKTLKQGLVYYHPTDGYMLYGWQNIGDGTYHFQETDGHAIDWYNRNDGGSAHTHDATAIAQLAIRCAVTADGYSDPVRVGSSQVWNTISNSTAQEYIRIVDRVTKRYHSANADPDNPAYASCTQAVAHIVRATVDPNMHCDSTLVGKLRIQWSASFVRRS